MYLVLWYTVQYEVPVTVQLEVPGTSHDNSTYVAGSRAGTVPADRRVAGGGSDRRPARPTTGSRRTDSRQAGGPTLEVAGPTQVVGLTLEAAWPTKGRRIDSRGSKADHIKEE